MTQPEPPKTVSSIVNFFKFLVKPIPLAIQLTAAVIGIVTAKFDFRTADLTTTALLSVSPVGAAEMSKRLREGSLNFLDGSGSLEDQLARAVRNGMFPKDLLSYQFFINNYSDINANNVGGQIAFWRGGKIVYKDFLFGKHDIPAKNGEITGELPMRPELENIDEISFCLSFQGRYFFDKTVIETKLVTISLAEFGMELNENQVVLAMAPITKAWGHLRFRKKQLFQIGEPCLEWSAG